MRRHGSPQEGNSAPMEVDMSRCQPVNVLFICKKTYRFRFFPDYDNGLFCAIFLPIIVQTELENGKDILTNGA